MPEARSRETTRLRSRRRWVERRLRIDLTLEELVDAAATAAPARIRAKRGGDGDGATPRLPHRRDATATAAPAGSGGFAFDGPIRVAAESAQRRHRVDRAVSGVARTRRACVTRARRSEGGANREDRGDRIPSRGARCADGNSRRAAVKYAVGLQEGPSFARPLLVREESKERERPTAAIEEGSSSLVLVSGTPLTPQESGALRPARDGFAISPVRHRRSVLACTQCRSAEARATRHASSRARNRDHCAAGPPEGTTAAPASANAPTPRKGLSWVSSGTRPMRITREGEREKLVDAMKAAPRSRQQSRASSGDT